jgi:hypothetical protein
MGMNDRTKMTMKRQMTMSQEVVMRGFRTSIAAGLLAAAVAVSLAAWSNDLPGPTANTRADTQPRLLPEVVITAPAPELLMMDTVYVSATRETGSGIAARDKAGRSAEKVLDGGGNVVPVRKPIAGYALGLLPRMRTDPADAVLGLFWNVAAGSFRSASRLWTLSPALSPAR